MAKPSDLFTIPLDDWVEFVVKDWLVPNFRPVFQAIKWPVDQVLNGFDAMLQVTPMLAFLLVAVLVAWRVSGVGLAVFTFVALVFLDLIQVWPETMTTLAMIVTAVVFCTAAGVPLGIAAARSDRFASGLRPVLDIMQTIPPFVYLVPIVMLFGVG
ncbi:MAG: hypothetical protein WD270_08320, partial [Acetobacterales bacterium]